MIRIREGQPVRISLSFTYSLNPKLSWDHYINYMDNLGNYDMYNMRDKLYRMWHNDFEPPAFWNHRELISQEMEKEVGKLISESDDGVSSGGSSNSRIEGDGCDANMSAAKVVAFQLLGVEFMSKYEDSIIGIQLASQSKNHK